MPQGPDVAEPTTRVPHEPRSDADTTVNRPPPFHEEADGLTSVDSSTPTRDGGESSRTLAYSNTNPDKDVPEEPVPTRTRTEAARPSRTARSRGTNRMAIWALVLSILGITAPIGLFLGYRARSAIARTRELGEPFARVAIWIGWLYIVVFVLALVTYFWIAGQGS